MIVQKAFKIRLYPTKEQKVFFNKTFGCCRIIYNSFLYMKNKFYEEIIKPARLESGYFDLKNDLEKIETEYKKLNKKNDKSKLKELSNQKKEIKAKLNIIKEKTSVLYENYKMPSIAEFKHSIKSDDGYEYMFEADSQGSCNAYRDLQTAFNNFYDGRAKFPRYKKKKEKQSYRNGMMHSDIHELILDNYIVIPKAGKVKFRQDYSFENLGITKIYNVTIEKSKTNKYFCSICCDVDVQEYEHTGNCIGVDLGIKDLVITSNGEKFDNPKLLYKTEKLIKKLSKQFSKKQKGSRNCEKSRIKLATAHEKLSNQRKDNLHKITTRLIKENSVICIENLNVKGMVRNHALAKAIQDASFGTLVSMLKYKAAWHNRQIIEVGRFYPSSKTCSCCGHRMSYMGLEVRQWTCPNCNTHHDRDINAAKNILNEGLRILDVGQELPEFKPVENPTMDDKSSICCSLKSSDSMKQENQLSLAVD